MNITELETLVVEKDEVLIVRIEADMEEHAEQLRDFLNNGPLRGRYVVFVGRVEFAKVKT